MFDEAFFAYCEDTDLGMRLRWAGYKCFAAPGAEVLHYYSMTAGKFSRDKIFWVERNHFWVAVKNFPIPLLFVVPFATLWRYALQAYAVLTRTGDLHEFAEQASFASVMTAVVRAQGSALAGLFPMVLGLGVYLYALLERAYFVASIAMVAILAGVVWYLLGLAVLRRFGFPIALIFPATMRAMWSA